MSEKKPLIIIGGATAVGKTKISVELAKAVDGEIISADSMQIYKGMDIGTAKVTKEEMQGVSHFLIDEVDPGCDFNVYEFKLRAKKYIESICGRGHIPVLAGGTGFYIQSVLYDIDFTDEDGQSRYRIFLESQDPQKLYEMLKKADPDSAGLIHPNNKKRIIRALEYFYNTGIPISEHNRQQHQKEPPYNFVYFVLNRNREVIYERIERRVDLMMEQGLIDEVKGLLEKGVSKDSLSMQAIGYKEMASYIKGEIGLDEARDLIKLNSRHFAKRQITWFKREKEAVWINYEDHPGQGEMLAAMISILKERHIV